MEPETGPDVSAVLDAAKEMASHGGTVFEQCVDEVEHEARRLAWQHARDRIGVIRCRCSGMLPQLEKMAVTSVLRAAVDAFRCDRCRELAVCDAARAALEVG